MLERLQKIISRAGIASRRHAEQLILSGQVRVNGRVVTELGSKADAERDRIEAAGKLVHLPEKKTYLVVHKPPEVVSTMADPEGRRSLRNLLGGLPARVFPVGRLEYAASGLLLLTNDGELANRMLKAAARLPQTYWVKVKGRLDDAEMRRVAKSIRGRVWPLRSPHASRGRAENPWYEVTLSEARRDLLRRTLLELGHPVEKMKRVRVANLDLEGLSEGKYRPLEDADVAGLERFIARASKPPGEASPARAHKKAARA